MTESGKLPSVRRCLTRRRIAILDENGNEGGEMYIQHRQPTSDEHAYAEQVSANRWMVYSAAIAWVKDVRELSSLDAADHLLRLAIGDGRIQQRPEPRHRNLGGDIYALVANQPDVVGNDVRREFPEVIDGSAIAVDQLVIKSHRRPGRPGVGHDVRAAFNALKAEGKISFSASKSSNYPAIRERMRDLGAASDLDDETLRIHTLSFFPASNK